METRSEELNIEKISIFLDFSKFFWLQTIWKSVYVEGYLLFIFIYILLRISMKNMTRLFSVSSNNNNISQIKAQ